MMLRRPPEIVDSVCAVHALAAVDFVDGDHFALLGFRE
ncbi:hypothetical protein SFMTTN_2369 [Sulfuriferula multivorans]|uniref:Uncharacterized protein n=1 Tax=Sulfuriferula multivorans TaxID=1559896 RepID=A0A401JG06_9PROT|nr:hypothetical protein SFMTTN_2369 [Sulfuriferula multivorans]